MSKELLSIKELVSRLTLEEKALLVSGADSWHTEAIERLGIPRVMVSDGPHGLRKQAAPDEKDHLGTNPAIDAVCFPAACCTASSFDLEMMYAMGQTLGKECQAEDVACILGPAVNIKRSPLCGRNFEYISEDPYLAGEMAAAYIAGVQSQNVGTSIKHFAANNQEHERMNGSSDVDERTLREIYLAPFETAVKKSRPWTVMCSYNKINGSYSSQNPWLLNQVLRSEWGFDGLVMSDWGAVSDRIEGIRSGLDLEMPGSGHCNDARIIQAVKNGTLPEEDLDKAAENVIAFAFRYANGRAQETFDRDRDHELAVRFAENSMVLLKNEQVLPLSPDEKVAIIGGYAEKPRYQGGGSSHINTSRVQGAWPLAREYGNTFYAEGFDGNEDFWDENKAAEAVRIASEADKIVVFAGLPDSFESEGYDRSHMRLPVCQNRLIGELVLLNKPVIIVLHNGAPVEMPWVHQVQGILEAYLGGEGVGRAVLEILYGKVNPSGKLAESFPVRLEDNPSYLFFGGKEKHVRYAEGVFVGYRYYDSKKAEVLFPFGHGLSYTTFAYSNLRVGKAEMPKPLMPGVPVSGQAPQVHWSEEPCITFAPDELVAVRLDVTNTGSIFGREIVQLYVADRTDSQVRPVHELKNFVSVSLQPGETKTVTMLLNYRSFAWYDVAAHGWFAANGAYELQIGSSSRDIRMAARAVLTGNREILPEITPDVMLGDLMSFPKTEDFVRNRLRPWLMEASGVNTDEEFENGLQELVHYMPLRNLRSFGGMDNETMEKLVAELKELMS